MTPLVPLAMLGWIPFSIWVFSKLRPTRAAITTFALGWMFLPEYSYDLSGIPDYSKVAAIAYGILLGTLLFNANAIKEFKFSVLDLPILIWCAVPLFTSISNDLGAYDGIAFVVNRSTQWGLPYFIGRIYFKDRQSLTELAFGMFVAGLIYMPFCWFEVLMSPQLHRIVYGWHPHEFAQSVRGGGYRPVVFMAHGLMVAMWMGIAFLSGLQLLRTGWIREKFGSNDVYFKLLIIILGLTVLLTKSTGAIAILLASLFIIYILKFSKTIFPLVFFILIPILYVLLRSNSIWSGEDMVNIARTTASEERAVSLHFRLTNENIIISHALNRPWLGWGGFQRSFVFDDNGKASVPDGMWIGIFALNGIIGLTSLGLLLLLPLILLIYTISRDNIPKGYYASFLALPVILLMFTLDSLFNAMFNPLVIVISGGITSFYLMHHLNSSQVLSYHTKLNNSSKIYNKSSNDNNIVSRLF